MTRTTATLAARWAVVALGLLGATACSQSGKMNGGQANSTLPQFGKASLPDVLAALTTEEKAKLVVGMGFYPSGFPEGVLPPGDREVPEKVPGAAGRTHAIARLGIPLLTLLAGPAGVRIDPKRGSDTTKTYYATAFSVATLLVYS